jgi:hypothetical protein
LEDLSYVVVGFSNGSVLVVKGDVQRGRVAKIKLQTPDDSPVTCVGICAVSKNVFIFVTTERQVVMFTNCKQESMVRPLVRILRGKEVLDDNGAEKGRAVFTDELELLVARKEVFSLLFC